MNSQGFDISLFMEGRTNTQQQQYDKHACLRNEDGLRIAQFLCAWRPLLCGFRNPKMLDVLSFWIES